MGEIADMIIDGTLDSKTGELIDGDSPGYPRTKQDKGESKSWACSACSKKFTTEQGSIEHFRVKHKDLNPTLLAAHEMAELLHRTARCFEEKTAIDPGSEISIKVCELSARLKGEVKP